MIDLGKVMTVKGCGFSFFENNTRYSVKNKKRLDIENNM